MQVTTSITVGGAEGLGNVFSDASPSPHLVVIMSAVMVVVMATVRTVLMLLAAVSIVLVTTSRRTVVTVVKVHVGISMVVALAKMLIVHRPSVEVRMREGWVEMRRCLYRRNL